MKNYVVGFLFCEKAGHQEVLLIQKVRPEWQKGKLNGIGGHIEVNESPMTAMVREFKEETGLLITSWVEFVDYEGMTPEGEAYRVHFYKAFGDISKAQTMTDEEVIRFPIHSFNFYPLIPNLRWLLPMALRLEEDNVACYHILEVL